MPERGEIPKGEEREILYLPHGNVEIKIVPEPVFDEFSDNATYEEIVEFQDNGGAIK